MPKPAYINPVPTIDMGRKFEIRLVLEFAQLADVEEARKQAAEWLLKQDPAAVASWMRCSDVKPVYPDELTADELIRIGLKPGDSRLSFAIDGRKEEEPDGQDG